MNKFCDYRFVFVFFLQFLVVSVSLQADPMSEWKVERLNETRSLKFVSVRVQPSGTTVLVEGSVARNRYASSPLRAYVRAELLDAKGKVLANDTDTISLIRLGNYKKGYMKTVPYVIRLKTSPFQVAIIRVSLYSPSTNQR